MKRSSSILRYLLMTAVALPLGIVLAKKLPAGFAGHDYRTHVEIDGVNYGPFETIEGLDQFVDGVPNTNDHSFARITLRREFVTDPSLYLWAKNQTSKKYGLRDISLVTTDELGNYVSRKVLRLCQPLSWTVEASNPSLGGFNEKVDIAVQHVEAF